MPDQTPSTDPVIDLSSLMDIEPPAAPSTPNFTPSSSFSSPAAPPKEDADGSFPDDVATQAVQVLVKSDEEEEAEIAKEEAAIAEGHRQLEEYKARLKEMEAASEGKDEEMDMKEKELAERKEKLEARKARIQKIKEDLSQE